MKYTLSYKNFVIASIGCIVVASAIFLVTGIFGNEPFFLLLNNDYGAFTDASFAFITHLGEAAPWITIGLLVLIFRRRFLPLILIALIISTALAQGIKNNLPEQPRPTKAITNLSLIHTVKGVDLHTINSFPSGHTTTAFTVFLLACLLVHKRWIIWVGFIYALAVGYSRIYLAQHFPKDVAGGMLVAVITTCFAVALQQIIANRFYKKV
ncbi:MAG: phosphatase PAP2 family protein [Pedobacter sp.]|nr:phosphatase PAP2 family protein [Chitinophagaceae bacterium]